MVGGKLTKIPTLTVKVGGSVLLFIGSACISFCAETLENWLDADRLQGSSRRCSRDLLEGSCGSR